MFKLKSTVQPLVFQVKDPSTPFNLSCELIKIFSEPFIILCIGTDRCIGDSLGPLVGHNLKKRNFPLPVFGTIDHPIHAINLLDNISHIKNFYPDHKIIAIDASLGNKKSVGTIQFRSGPIYPGRGVGKKLPPIGDYSIIGIIDTVKNFNMSNIHQIRLSIIMKMAEIVTDSIILAYDALNAISIG